jgi:beta-phosphoglucomutase-like phosphatase (HAD superfamily)
MVGDQLRRRRHHRDETLTETAERAGALPVNSIVFEDAPLGVEAARRAGMRAVVLTTTLPAEAFAEYDNVIAVARDFSELDIDALFASEPYVDNAATN